MVFDADVMRQQAEDLEAELEQVRFSGRSQDGVVTAVVTGHGRLLDLTVAQAVLRSAHPQVVGPDVVEAVSAARRAASAVSVVKMRAVLDKEQVWHPEPVHTRPGVPAPGPDLRPVPRPPLRAELVTQPQHNAAEEENSEELDFLTDEGAEDEDRDRW